MESPSLRTTYLREMETLERDVLEMASRAESMVTRAVDSLYRLDTGTAREVMDEDDEIDIKEILVEQRCLKLLALQQPMASDLREIGSVIRIITDLERIGDLAVDVAKICLKVDKEFGHTDYVDLPLMSNVARQMLRLSTQMFARKDIEAYQQVQALEDQVDELYRSLRDQTFQYMLAHPEEVVAAGWLLYAVHHLERIADHSVSIAERVVFMVTGRMAGAQEERP